MPEDNLSSEQRHEIFLEEKARMEIHQEPEGPKTAAVRIPSSGRVVLGLFGLIVVVMIGVKLSSFAEQSNGTQSPDAIKVVRSSWYCSPGSEDKAAQLNLAIARKDMLAAAGHVSRNGAFQLETGTPLRVLTHGASSLVLVRVTSGLHDGEECWLPASMTY